jgi:hypothetical protein
VIETTLSPEMIAARLGKLTASRIADATAKIAKGWGASRANYMAELIAERLTGVQADRFVSKEMLHGIVTEPDAIAAYEYWNDVDVDPMGFVDHPTIPMSGASPDGGILDAGLVEFKCPNTSTHIDFLLSDEIDLKYRKQMQWQMACTGRAYCDFGSFDPRMPEELQLRVRRVMRDDKMIAELEADARTFLADLDAKERALRAMLTKREAA